jgi:protein FrlC
VNLSVATSVFVNYLLRDVIPIVAETGYDGIDIWGGRPHIYRQDYPVEELSVFRKLLKEHNLKPVSFMPAFFRYPHSISSPNEKVRRDSINYMLQCTDNAVELGAETLLVIPGHSLNGQEQADAYKRMAESIATICDHSTQYDIRLGIEPANRMVTDLVNTAADAMALINELGYGNLGVVLDTGHVNLGSESLEAAISITGSTLLQIHVNDNDGQKQQNLIPGDGTFDFAGSLKTLVDCKFDGYLTVELGWDYTLNPVSAIREAAVRLRNMVAGITTQ